MSASRALCDGDTPRNLAATISNPPHLKAAFVVVAPSTMTHRQLHRRRLQAEGLRRLEPRTGHVRRRDRAVRLQLSGLNLLGPHRYRSAQRKFIDIPIYQYGGWYDIFNEGNVRNFMYLQHDGSVGRAWKPEARDGSVRPRPFVGRHGIPGYGGGIGNAQGGAESEMRWWEYWLKGVDNGIMSEPPVKAYMMAGARRGAVSPKNRWMHFGDWPPAPATTNYYLRSDGSLTTEMPRQTAAPKVYMFDPKNPVQTIGGANLTFDRGPMDQRPIGQRQDYLRFQTAPLEKDVVIAGPVSMDLWAATDGSDTDFVVKLVDVYPDGYEAIILDTAIRTRYRNGRMPDEIAMMTPNAPEKLTLDLWDTAITFEAGHRIAVHVTSSNYPRIDANPNTGGNPGPGVKTRVAKNTIYMDASKPSAIHLPILVLPE
jgi:putative CocE/NonD family hydrolase